VAIAHFCLGKVTLCRSLLSVIHATAIIHPGANLAPSVKVGPYAIIEAGATIGRNCVIGPYVYITGVTNIGENNRFFPGCIIGEAPQDLKYNGTPTQLRIGNHNTFREQVTIHRSTKAGGETLVGSDNFLMAHAHVAHDCVIADKVIIANGALLGGHVSVAERAFISGNCLVHQFVRVGALALMRGGSAISKDLPPFTVAAGDNNICGLNNVGLRRAGLSSEERLQLKQVYHEIFRRGVNLMAAVESARSRFQHGPALLLLDFLAASKRGFCHERLGSVSTEIEDD
jgi:UDP-N-acetylglucosamine acyltransferase